MLKTLNAMTATAAAVLMVTTLVATGPANAAESQSQPYAGLQTRPVKALSAAQIDDYRNGRGMSLALAAELNGYPGPRHVLDLAEPLALTPAQREQTQSLFDSMRVEAIDLGERIVAREADLDRLFADATASPEAVEALAVSIGQLNGQLRFTHLHYHLAMRDLLSAAQIDAYATLRGYRSEPGRHGHGDGHRGTSP